MRCATYILVASFCVSFASLAGCIGRPSSTTMELGDAPEASTFAAARNVFVQYFSIETDDAAHGMLVSRPKVTASGPLGPTQQQIATLVIRRSRGQTLADLAVEIQQREIEPPMHLSDSGRPQNLADDDPRWSVVSYDRALEATMLEEIRKAIGAEQ